MMTTLVALRSEHISWSHVEKLGLKLAPTHLRMSVRHYKALDLAI
jgi:hypothetical protein